MRTPGSRIRISRIRTPASCMNRELLNQELSKVEKPAGIANPKDFRNEVVKFTLRAGPAAAAKIPPGQATRKSGRLSRGACSAKWRTCFRSSASARRRTTRPRKAQRVRPAYGVARLYGAAGSQAGRMVYAREAGWTEGTPRAHRRSAPDASGKSLGNRQRFIRRARALVRHAVLRRRRIAK